MHLLPVQGFEGADSIWCTIVLNSFMCHNLNNWLTKNQKGQLLLFLSEIDKEFMKKSLQKKLHGIKFNFPSCAWCMSLTSSLKCIDQSICSPEYAMDIRELSNCLKSVDLIIPKILWRQRYCHISRFLALIYIDWCKIIGYRKFEVSLKNCTGEKPSWNLWLPYLFDLI